MKRTRSSAPQLGKQPKSKAKGKADNQQVSSAVTTASACAALPSSPSATSPSSSECRSALVVVGSYHAVMTGLVLRKEKFYLKFAIKHHVGSVTHVAVTDRWVASCGTDERVFLFTNKAERRLPSAQLARLRAAGEPMSVRLADLGSLTPPCEVRCLAFASGSQYLLCGCAEGQLLVYRTRDWALTRTLEVHERALLSLAVHPGSAGTLVVTIGADRSVTVLDLARGRLLTKWRYSATSGGGEHTDVEAVGESENRDEPARSTEGKDITITKAAAEGHHCKRARREANPLQRLFAREEPSHVIFSPAGTHFLVHARFSLVVYAASSMTPVMRLPLPQPPQPDQEIHSAVFLDEDTILVGNEAAQLLSCRVTEKAASRLQPVKVVYPPALQAEAAALLAGPIHVESEVRQRHPLRHVSRVKGLRVVGRTLFTADSNGFVFSWTLGEPAAEPADGAVVLTYVTSANCQGRATSLDVLPL